MENISPVQLHELLNSGEDVLLIDVREKFEYDEGHIKEAKHIPMSEVLNHVDEFKKYDKVYFICLTDARAELVCNELNRRGVNAINVKGGMMVWRMNMFPVV